ncbi:MULTISPECIES: P-loop NTPase fold protein [unclassified Clostridium]|uniref:KAP family P-loop NTPase fold protein n=1 Tax=unclassified Clostridium TaxID=2614128 RepID=UPI0002973B41|nr:MULTISPECIES: P-loop NTPase fold protein [unclassified Clostridium]EKQ54566.1 MAG: KAP family P-loop domain protein [Clostridium sp. Maddingley MBC34-26]
MERYINDEWTLKDELGYQEVVDQVNKIIFNAEPPFTIGIYGGWGYGKTSIMRQLYFMNGGEIDSYKFPFVDEANEEIAGEEKKEIIEKLKEKGNINDYEAVWYNPWEHQFEKEPVIGLLHEIRERFNFFTKSTEEAKKLADISIRTGIDIISGIINAITKVKVDASNIEKYGEKYEKNNFEIASSSQRFKLLFEQAVKKLLGDKKDRKLIIFIDDLDRCEDDSIINLIRGIKLYLSTSNCIFVLGMDQINVMRALKKNNIHKDYLDKLFQCIIRVPLSNNYKKFIVEITKAYYSNKSQYNEFCNLLTDILEKNPRKVKNFLNSFRTYYEIAERSFNGSEFRIEILILFHYLRVYYEPIFAILEREHSFIENLINVCKGENANNKVELMFKRYLDNPFVDYENIPLKFETEEVISDKLEDIEFSYMEEISYRYEALKKFKEYLVKYFDKNNSEFTTKKLIKYIGTIEVN